MGTTSTTTTSTTTTSTTTTSTTTTSTTTTNTITANQCWTKSGAMINAPCIFPFIYQGVTYTSCTTAGRFSEPWCSTATDTNGNHIIGYWGNCGSGCPVSTAASTTTTCSTPCKFPFIYRGVVHNACTYAGGFSPAWCSTATDAYGKHINGNWANCGAGCPVEITTG